MHNESRRPAEATGFSEDDRLGTSGRQSNPSPTVDTNISPRRAALEIARALAAAGIPIFLAEPALDELGKPDHTGGHNGCGYWLPPDWQQTIADPSVVDQWRQGQALCMVTGQGLDVLDIDPRNGGRLDESQLDGARPTVYARADTPSGGRHLFIASLGIGTTKLPPAKTSGVDIKAGAPGGKGRGFVFIAPTLKISKVTGNVGRYVWTEPLDPGRLGALGTDRSGAPLVELLTGNGSTGSDGKLDEFMQAGPWSDVAGLLAAGRNDAVHKLAASLRGQGRFRFVEDAIDHMAAEVWPLIDQEQAGHEFPFDEFEAAIRSAWQRYPDGAEQQAGPGAAGVEGAETLNVGNPAIMADWLRAALGTGRLAGVFVRGDKLVHTPREGEDGYLPLTDNEADDDGPAQVRPAGADYIASRVQYSYTCQKLDKRSKTWAPALFPVAAARVAVNAVDLLTNLRRLRGVVHAPIVRADGSLLDRPGYDPATRLLYLPEPGLEVPPVPDRPTADDLRAAVAMVTLPVVEFPFESVHDRANWLGTLLTPVLRELSPPPYKAPLVEARQPGSGKTFLANMIRVTHGGVFRSEMPEDEAELRKQISTILDVTTGPVVVLDNVSGALRSSVLSGLLSSDRWDDRKLGTMETMISRPNDRLWIMTGNNVVVGGDLPRRLLRTTIDPGVPNPELRTGFKIADPVGWMQTNRGRTIHALLVIVRSWALAGAPRPPARSSDSYADWVRTVDGILSHAGIEGTFDHESTRVTVAEEDVEWRDFLEAVHAAFAGLEWPVRELVDRLDRAPFLAGQLARPADAKPTIPWSALPAEVSGLAPGTLAKPLGQLLRRNRGRWAGRYSVEHGRGDAHEKIATWKVRVAPE